MHLVRPQYHHIYILHHEGHLPPHFYRDPLRHLLINRNNLYNQISLVGLTLSCCIG